MSSAEGTYVWDSVSKAQGKDPQEPPVVWCHERVRIVPRLLQETCVTTSVEITIHHSSTLLTTFLNKLNTYFTPVCAVHALH